jgi:DNA-binding PadR family transcriptional regulator
MNLLMEHPMHPYEMKLKMKERGHDQVIRLKGGSIYDTVERLEDGGFITSQAPSREGRRPERTVYAITDNGRDEIRDWLAELLAEPVHEYPQFGAALKRAEFEWVRNLITEIEDGKLWMTKEQMKAVGETFENRHEGGESRE